MSARMNAMENASKNAKEISEKLTLQFNSLRQARITQELCEIISGASALWKVFEYFDSMMKNNQLTFRLESFI